MVHEKEHLRREEQADVVEKKSERGRELALLGVAALCVAVRLAIAFVPALHVEGLYIEALWIPAILAFFLLFFAAVEWLLDRIADYVNQRKNKQ